MLVILPVTTHASQLNPAGLPQFVRKPLVLQVFDWLASHASSVPSLSVSVRRQLPWVQKYP